MNIKHNANILGKIFVQSSFCTQILVFWKCVRGLGEYVMILSNMYVMNAMIEVTSLTERKS